MPKRRLLAALVVAAVASAAGAAADEAAPATDGQETLSESVCRLIESSARAERLPVAFLTRLIWQESGFRADAASLAGAQGIAQFMPGAASERGVKNPFDPEEAIPKAAALLADLRQRFGNLGLAAAAYNAGPSGVANWRAGGFLPPQTRAFVMIVTRHAVEDWNDAATVAKLTDDVVFPAQTCLQETAAFRLPPAPGAIDAGPPLAPWGVQISGSFSKAAALAAYLRVREKYAAILGDGAPMVVGARLHNRGFSPFYGVRAPAATRAEAEALCARILRAGGACVTLRS